jgi:hypothetical protein
MKLVGAKCAVVQHYVRGHIPVYKLSLSLSLSLCASQRDLAIVTSHALIGLKRVVAVSAAAATLTCTPAPVPEVQANAEVVG